MRSGAAYREALRDGRRVFVLGEGRVEDVTTHPATKPMVDEYVAWYDRLHDPAWRETAWKHDGAPVPYLVPRSADDLVRMGRFFSATSFLSAGNITHTPCYGHMISLGIQHAVTLRNASDVQVRNAEAYRAHVAATERFITFAAGHATIGYRMRPDPADRTSLRIVKETDAGLVVNGKIGMHTSPAFVEDVYIGAGNGVDYQGHRATFAVAVNSPGVTVICRKRAARETNPFAAPLSNRFDELDGQMWLDDVLVPWERVFLTEPSAEPIARWLFWHQCYCWLAHAEFSLGLALACSQAMGLMEHPVTSEYIVDLVADVQTVRSCLTACERDPSFTDDGIAAPNHAHLSVASLAMLRARPHMEDILRSLPGSSLINAPSDADLAHPDLAAGLDESFGGGGWTAQQRSALLNMTWDHVGSALNHRESVYELHANGGAGIWRHRLRRAFDSYNDLANGVLRQLPMPMPAVDLSPIRDAPMVPRRPVTPPAAPGPNKP